MNDQNMKSLMNTCLLGTGLTLCLSGAVALRQDSVRGGSQEAHNTPRPPDESVGAPGTRAVLLPGQAALIQVTGTTFNEGNFNGQYSPVNTFDGLRLYRLGSTDYWCGYCPRTKHWVIGLGKNSVESGSGTYSSPAGSRDSIPVSGWRASPVWPGSAPAPTVSVIAARPRSN